MVPAIIYWACILVGIAWTVLSIGLSLFYLARKENGNLWAFTVFNILVVILLAIILVVYRTWDFDISTYSSLINLIIWANVALTVIQAILGRVKKPVTA